MAEDHPFDAWCVPAFLSTGDGPPAPASGTVRTTAPVRTVESDRTGMSARAHPTDPPPPTLRYPELSTEQVELLGAELRRARERALLPRPAADLARVLGGVGARFLDPADPLRRRALELLPPTAGVSPSMAKAILDGMAADWTPGRLLELLERELADPTVLDRFVPDGSGRSVRALGAPLQVHLTAGTVPGVSVTSLVRALLVKGAVLLKPGRGDVALPVLFLGALAEADLEVARAAAVTYWPGGDDPAENAALTMADLVVVYGGDATVGSVRARIAPTTPLVAYHHRISLGVVGRGALGADLERTAGAAARAVALFDQRGCVSPHQIYVEEGGDGAPREFAGALGAALEVLEGELPPGAVEGDEAAARQQLRGTAELRTAAGEDVVLLGGAADGWTVMLDPDPAFEPSCLNRFVRVCPVPDAEDVPGLLAPLGRHLQSVAVAGLGLRTAAVAEALARVGALRVTSFEGQPFPPPWWHHDGSGPLRALMRWVDLELPGQEGRERDP